MVSHSIAVYCSAVVCSLVLHIISIYLLAYLTVSFIVCLVDCLFVCLFRGEKGFFRIVRGGNYQPSSAQWAVPYLDHTVGSNTTAKY